LRQARNRLLRVPSQIITNATTAHRQGKSHTHRRPDFSVRVDKNGRLKFTGVTDPTTILIFLKREIHELEYQIAQNQ